MKTRIARAAIACAVVLLVAQTRVPAQKAAWRQATETELKQVLPSRAGIENEHIETEMRTASGIVNGRGRYIAGVVLLTAGYSAEGKYSHYMVVQVAVRMGGVALKPGTYAFGWRRADEGDVLNVHFNDAATGTLVGITEAHLITGSHRVESLHIWPPDDKSLIQIGRFGIPYKIGTE
jgi:hypothetical protein